MAEPERALVKRGESRAPAKRGASVAARMATRAEINPEALIKEAIRQNIGPEGMRELMAMRKELVAEQARRDFYAELKAFQSELKPIMRTRVVKNKAERIAEGQAEERFRYAPIEKIASAIQAGADAHGFSYTFNTGKFENQNIPVHCTIHHIGGHDETTTFPSPVLFEQGAKIGQSPQQCMNGAITFGRRVSLIMGFGIMTADPDPEGDHEGKEIKEPSAVAGEGAKAEPVKSAGKGAPKPVDLDEMKMEILTLIAKKATGKAAERFRESAETSYKKGFGSQLTALRDSLRRMKDRG